jgi:hypothetical protein
LRKHDQVSLEFQGMIALSQQTVSEFRSDSMRRKMETSEDSFSYEEAARRRDAVVRRMIATPPQHKITPKPKTRPGSKGRVHKGRTKS